MTKDPQAAKQADQEPKDGAAETTSLVTNMVGEQIGMDFGEDGIGRDDFGGMVDTLAQTSPFVASIMQWGTDTSPESAKEIASIGAGKALAEATGFAQGKPIAQEPEPERQPEQQLAPDVTGTPTI